MEAECTSLPKYMVIIALTSLIQPQTEDLQCIIRQILRQLTTEGPQRTTVVQSTTAVTAASRTETGNILDLGTGGMNGEEDNQQEPDITSEEVHREQNHLQPASRGGGCCCIWGLLISLLINTYLQ